MKKQKQGQGKLATEKINTDKPEDPFKDIKH